MKVIINGETHDISDVAPGMTLLRYLRTCTNLKGTKEGCASGDCGACTVLMAEAGRAPRSINACITLLGNMQNKYVYTVEGLGKQHALHPVQQAMVDRHGSQCGFCTPGFVMSLAGLYHNAITSEEKTASVSRAQVCDAISGNLCRCTGYRPIIDAGLQMLQNLTGQLPPLSDSSHRIACGYSHQRPPHAAPAQEGIYLKPASEEELQQYLREYEKPVLVAGGTDLVLEITQRFRQYPVIIDLSEVQGMTGVSLDHEYLWIGGAAPYTALEAAAESLSPWLLELLHRLGSRQIRNRGTVGGNIANGSPIADMPPVLLAWDAEIEVVDASGQRNWWPVADVFLDYRKTVLRPGEYIARIRIARSRISKTHRFYKLSKRYEDDISSVMAAISFSFEGNVLADVRLAFGGMASTPLRFPETEQLLENQPLTGELVDRACQHLSEQLKPISDVRASAGYRYQMALNLLRKALLEVMHSEDIDVFRLPRYAASDETSSHA